MTGTTRKKLSGSWPVVIPLVLLSAWAIAYELADTVLGSWASAWPFSGIRPDFVFAAAGLLLIARALLRGGERAWILIGIGCVCWASGDVYFNTYLAKLSSPPVPSWADAGYLLFCPLTFAGIFLLARSRLRAAPLALIADAAAAALAVGALSAAVVVRQVLAHASGGTLGVATNLAYPLVDLLLLGLIVGVVALGDWRLERRWILLGVGVVAFWVADSLYLITTASNTYNANAWFNPLWFWSPIALAWAAWLPRPKAFHLMPTTASARGIVMPLLFAGVALGLLVSSSFSSIGVVAIVLCTLSLLSVMVRLVIAWRENASLLRASRSEALTDSLTSLANRRALTLEIERRMANQPGQGYALALFDLDGFKHYNDSFGHAAGDALLQRLGQRLRSQIEAHGRAYRMGGDEFCVLIDDVEEGQIRVREAAAALSEHGEGFEVGCSWGFVVLPDEAQEASEALRLADQRMYTHKHSGRASASRQSGDVLLRLLAERDPNLGNHMEEVAVLAEATARQFGLPQSEIERIRQAAELHDVGKVAIPDQILNKPARLNEEEWTFIRRHTLIGERILAAAPALRNVAGIVRSTHEKFDGTGYPDGLAGEQIPLGARIIAVCDAFHAMTSDRPHRQALDVASANSELVRCSGSQFDPAVVEMFFAVLTERARPSLRVA
jgi:two-component system cell cycle response regulator